VRFCRKGDILALLVATGVDVCLERADALQQHGRRLADRRVDQPVFVADGSLLGPELAQRPSADVSVALPASSLAFVTPFTSETCDDAGSTLACKSDPNWTRSSQSAGRDQIRIVDGFSSEWVDGLRRNLQARQ
jgi:hypothetical protein